jgi:SAM-dependent methyltransferase
MTANTQLINEHYSDSELKPRIISLLEKAGKDFNALSREDIEKFDEFHIRGREATRDLANLARLQKGEKVLDLGCGLGGAARTLVEEFACSVTGIDLVEDYIQAAIMLSEQLGKNNQIDFRVGNVLDLPFENDSFDVVMSEHVIMNIEDKAQMFSEMKRVLREKGRFAIYVICAGPNKPIQFPVPWASDPAISFLSEENELREELLRAGFQEKEWKNVSSLSLQWFQETIAANQARPADAPPPLGLNVLMGSTTAEKFKSLGINLREDRIRVFQGVFEKIS